MAIAILDMHADATFSSVDPITSFIPSSQSQASAPLSPGDTVTVIGSGFMGPTMCNSAYDLELECSAYLSLQYGQLWSHPSQFQALRCTYVSTTSILVRVPHTSLGANYLTIIEVSSPGKHLTTGSHQIHISIPSKMKVFTFTGAPQVISGSNPSHMWSDTRYVKWSLWGAPGQGSGGKGGLTEGVIAHSYFDWYSITIGGTDGYNGGGVGSNCPSGGGATDVRKNGDTLAHRVMVAGGGGGFGQHWAGFMVSNCGQSGGHFLGLPNACCDMNIDLYHQGITWAGHSGGPPAGELDDRLDEVTFPLWSDDRWVQLSGGCGGSGTQTNGGTLRFGISTPTGVEGSLGQGGMCRRCLTNMGAIVGSGGGGGG